jgi:ubiquinone/menaquinone biosynthesis C-methylase UbiE
MIDFKTTDASSYDSVTAEFDRFTDRFSTPLAARMVALAEFVPAERVLDIGTGTGIVALHAAEKVGPNGRVVGIDLSDGMLAAARAKAARAGLSDRVEFRKMDAESLELKEKSFDTALSLFALLHFPDPLGALKEMLRVLRPGGKLVIAVGSGSPIFSLRGLVHRFRRLAEILLRLQDKRLFAPAFLNALVDKYIPASGEAEESLLARTHHNRTRSVPELVHKAGFSDVRSYWEPQRVIVDTPEEFWDLQRTFSSIARKRLSTATAAEVDSLREEFLRTCREVQSRGGKLVYPLAALYVVAQRPLLEERG